jgi:hypothetical protein
VASKIFWTDVVKIIKLTIRAIGGHHLRSSTLRYVDTGPTVSFIFGTFPVSPFLSVLSTVCYSVWISSVVTNRHLFCFNFIFGNRKKSLGVKSGKCGGWGMTNVLYFARKS